MALTTDFTLCRKMAAQSCRGCRTFTELASMARSGPNRRVRRALVGSAAITYLPDLATRGAASSQTPTGISGCICRSSPSRAASRGIQEGRLYQGFGVLLFRQREEPVAIQGWKGTHRARSFIRLVPWVFGAGRALMARWSVIRVGLGSEAADVVYGHYRNSRPQQRLWSVWAPP